MKIVTAIKKKIRFFDPVHVILIANRKFDAIFFFSNFNSNTIMLQGLCNWGSSGLGSVFIEFNLIIYRDCIH